MDFLFVILLKEWEATSKIPSTSSVKVLCVEEPLRKLLIRESSELLFLLEFLSVLLV
jgi:hypothetical protein